ncbi:bifunctional DNA primase/polymerase [Devosia lucknowensis]|uniref:bifunctional DNA primase/polymerase n=1 Tax=Devosia lucknowensis TaxID=1096929 RepID=UPI00148283B3|nr:bifunctional DNA primase/polymerase [Devosia lucknowensis]
MAPRRALDYALEYVDRDWPVFPCRPGNVERVDPETGEVRIAFTAKSPLTRSGFREASTSERVVRQFWTQNPNAMIGVPTGEAIGAFVLDLDVKVGANGFDWLREHEAIHGRLPDTLTANTASGGQHRYFRHVEGVRNTQGPGLASGADIRGQGGYVIVPGSVTSAGAQYTWVNPDEDIVDAPAWLLAMIVKERQPTSSIPEQGHANDNSAYVEAAISGEISALVSTRSGRNGALNKASFNLGTLIGAGAMTRADAEARLYGAAMANGYVAKDGEHSARATIKSGLDSGEQSPRDIPEATFVAEQDVTAWLPKDSFKSMRGVADTGRAETVEQQSASAAEVTPRKEKRERFDVTWFDDIEPSKPKKSFVKSVFGYGEFTVVVGLPGTGKSVIITDIACHVAAGMEWHGRKVDQGLVVYFAAERKDLTERRMLAFRKRHGVQDVPLLVIGGRVDLTKNLDDARSIAHLVNSAAEACGLPCRWIILDTLTRVFGAGDQNTSKDMTSFVQSVDEIMHATKAHVTVVHHTAWSGERGKGAIDLDGAVDASFIVKRDGARYNLTCDGTNDGEIGVITHFSMEGVVVGNDEDGEPTEAPVVVPVEGDPPKKLKSSGKTTKDRVFDALGDAVEACGVEPDGHHFPNGVSVVNLDQWRECYAATQSGQPDSVRRAFDRAKTSLISDGKVRQIGEWFFVC